MHTIPCSNCGDLRLLRFCERVLLLGGTVGGDANGMLWSPEARLGHGLPYRLVLEFGARTGVTAGVRSAGAGEKRPCIR